MAKTQEDLDKSRKVRDEVIRKFGEVPTSIWNVDYHWGKSTMELDSRKQQVVAVEKHKKMDYNIKSFKNSKGEIVEHNEMLDAFSMSSQNVRGKGSGLSTFPPDLCRKIVTFYSEEGDTILDPCCVGGETLISTVSGDFPIKDLVNKTPYVFCFDGDKIRIRKALRIWKTYKNTKVIKVILDSYAIIYATPEHMFMLRDGTYKMAKELKLNDSLMPFYRRKDSNEDRWCLSLNNQKSIKQSHYVYEEVFGEKINTKKYCIHHKDNNSLNDLPENLEKLKYKEHQKTYQRIGNKNNFYGKKHTKNTKIKIGLSSKNRNIGRKHTKSEIKKMVLHKKDKSYIKKVVDLLEKNIYSRKEIAKFVGVSRYTVYNIVKNMRNYNHKVREVIDDNFYMDVYNISVDEFHNYIANGVVIKNCGHASRLETVHKLNRHYIGYDICHEFCLFNEKVKENLLSNQLFPSKYTITLREQTSEKMVEESNSIDLVMTSPPYFKIEHYDDNPLQLGLRGTYQDFLDALEAVIGECYRVLKSNKYCVFNVNDFRMDGKYHMYHADTARLMEKVGFKLHDIIIVPWQSCIGACFGGQVWSRKVTAKKHEFLIVGKKVTTTDNKETK